jgi:cytochrome P450
MSPATETLSSPRPFDDIPRAGRMRLVRALLDPQGERVDMLTPLQSQYESCGSVVRQPLGPFRMLNLFGPDACQMVLMDRDGIFSARDPWTRIMGRIFPNGLLLRDGEDHKSHRRLMHQAFRRPVLRSYLERMNPMVSAGIAGWEQQSDFTAFGAVKALTLDMAASIFLGVDLGPDTLRLNRAFEDMVAASMSRLRLPIPGLEFHRGLEGRKTMIRFLSDQSPATRRGEVADLFSRRCRAADAAAPRLSDTDIIDHLVFLMMAAHDTSTSTLSSMIYELARHPEWQERVREEALAVGRPHLEYEETEQLRSLTWVMKEVLRRYPPLPVIPRITTQDFAWGGYEIPARSMLVVAPIHTHHMAEWWTAPFQFDPERFSPERDESDRHTFMWIPFGGGPHHCLGFKFAEAQIKSIMHQMVLRYRWSVDDAYRMPVQQAPISRPMDGLPVQLERIQ